MLNTIIFEENVINLNALLLHRDRTRPPRSFKAIAGVAVLIFVLILSFWALLFAGVLAAVVWITSKR